ncbi:MAG: DNA repair protein RadA [Acidimicrobiales bacterium]
MGKLRTTHRCRCCGVMAARWQGRCPGCGEWDALVEQVEPVTAGPAAGPAPGSLGERPQPIGEVDALGAVPRPTGVAELDRVLGGGLVPGSLTLVGGEPGIGKSTLLLQALAPRSEREATLLVCAEESAQQVRRRAERLGCLAPGLHLLAATTTDAVLAAVAEIRPSLLVVDSVQTVADPDLGHTPGSPGQVRAVAVAMAALARSRAMATVLVGHVTKDGDLAGPRVLEHLVDTVLAFEGDRHHALRLLRAVKHRFGATGELGLFEMGERGLTGVDDASGMLLGDRQPGTPGSVVVPVLEGSRILLVEVQSLVAPTTLTNPRRSVQGLDTGRLAQLVAVLHRHCGTNVTPLDVHAAVAGGVRVTEPAVDLGLALALASSFRDRAVPADIVAIGEVGLGGELRLVGSTPRRLAEAARLGFRRAILPRSAPPPPPGITALRAGDLRTALDLCGLAPAPS